MNRIAAIALFVVAGFATTHSATAETRVVATNIPFAFTVNGTTIPAGTYYVYSVSPHLMQIRSTDFQHPRTVSVTTFDSSQSKAGDATKLVFKNYGGQYFLHEIVSPAYSTDAEVPASNQEKKVRVEWAGKSGGQPVLVALN